MAQAASKRRERPKYRVTTWDMDAGRYGRFTPQKGVRCGPYTLFGLRKALRKLRDCGYSCDYRSNGGFSSGDPAVSVERL